MGAVFGFAFGVAIFLALFKIIFLDRIPREDELAPGIVVFASLLNGLLFACGCLFLQDYLAKKKLSR